MPSSWNPGPGMICPSCSRSHFPFCGRENHAIGQTGFPPYAHGLGPPPLLITPTNHLQPMAGAFGHSFTQPPVPSWNNNVLEHLGPPGNLRHESLLEQHQQPGLRVHGSIHHGDLMPGPRFPPHGLDRLEPVAGGHMGRSGFEAGNIWFVEEERERERQREREREIWLAERQRKGLVQQIDRFGVQGQGAADRCPPELVTANFTRPEIHMGKYNGIGEIHELRMRGDGQAELGEYNSYRGSLGVPSGHHNSGREYDVFPGAIRGGHQPFSHFEGSEAAPEGHQSVARFKGFDAMQGGRQSSTHYEGFEPAQGRHQSLARFEGFEPEQGWHQSSARFEGFEPTQGVLQGTDTSFSRAKQAVEFAEHIARPTNRGNDIDTQRYDGYRDFQGTQIKFPQGARKRTRIDGGDDLQDRRVGGFYKTNMQETDTQVLGKESFHYTVSSEREQGKQLLNRKSGDTSGAFGIEQIDKGNSNKRQRVVSREEELLLEHGLLDDSTDNKNDDTFESELLYDNKSLSQEGRHGFELTFPGRGNKNNAMPPQSASEAKDFAQKFQLSKGEGSYNGNTLDRGFSHNSSHDTFNDSVFLEARNQSRGMPLHLRASQRDLAQGHSVESGNFWHIKPNDMYSVPANEKFGSHENRATFHVTRDSSHTPLQKSIEAPIEVDRVHQPDSRKIGRFEEHLVSEGSAIHKFSELRPKTARECQQEESLKTIEELHMDFVHQQQKKIHNQSRLHPPQFEEETRGSNKGRNVLSQAHQQSFQDFSQNQIEIQKQVAKISSLGQSAYNQGQHLPTTHLSESNTIQDQTEHDTRAGESVSKAYGDRMHQNNLRAHHLWSETLQPSSSQLDLSSKKNNYLSATVHNYDNVQHPLSHHIVQQHNLRLHEQQQRPHQSDPRSHDSEQQEGQLMPNQEPQNSSRGQQNQLSLQQHGLSQLPRQQFQQHIQSHDQHHFPSNQPITEKQNPSEWAYQLQPEGDQEAGQRYQFEVKDSDHHQFNQKTNTSIQNPPQFPQQPERHWHMNGFQQQPQVEHAKSQYISTARGPEISHANMHSSYDLRADGGGMPPVIQTPAPMPKRQSLSQEPQVYTVCPPAPPLPPPPLPPSPPSSPSHAPPPPPPSPPASPPKSSASANFSLDATRTHSLPTSMRSFPDIKPSAHGYQYPPAPSHHGAGFASLGSQAVHQMPFKQFGDPAQRFPSKPTQDDRPKVVDAIHIFKQPGRIKRPDRFVVILRGLPGSGKSYLAKALRDLEVMNGGSAPRIHSMDDYFMTEVEKDDDNDNGGVTSSLLRSKKRVTKKVMEYCYEPEMEEAYRASMLKAFKKTLEEGVFTFIIVDDRNLRVADFAQFWAVAKRSGYEVYLLDAPYKDPAGCAARNVHNFTSEKVQEMAKCWEPAPPLYLQLDISALFHDDNLNAQNITEVEMDTDDTGHDVEDQDKLTKTEPGKTGSPSEFSQKNGVISPGDRWGLDELNARDEGKDLTRSKWSDNHKNGHNSNAKEVENVDSNALSGLMQAYGKGDRRVHWADQASSGFSIGRIPQNKCSLIIGPGEGYNEASNPLPDEEKNDLEYGSSTGGKSKRNTKILEQLRAEQETFRAVFDRRRHRIAVVDEDDD